MKNPPDAATNMPFAHIPAGSFLIGQDPRGRSLLQGGEWDEMPLHRVTISSPFDMSVTPVTNRHYEEYDSSHRQLRGCRGVSNADIEAVVSVSWEDAVAFCAWLSRREGVPYRLPTEAEWEYACRAGTTTSFWTGEELPEVFHRNQFREGDWNELGPRKDQDLRDKKGIAPVSLAVGASPANPWGVRDMHGLVEEWCRDWYGPYSEGSQVDPVGPSAGVFKVTRGGSHNTYARHLRSANRSGALPVDRHWLIGFRVVRADPPAQKPQDPVEPTLNDPTVSQTPLVWPEPTPKPDFMRPIPFVIPDREDPRIAGLTHHHHPAVTWCDNGDLLAVWFATRSEIGREMVILASRLRAGSSVMAGSWRWREPGISTVV